MNEANSNNNCNSNAIAFCRNQPTIIINFEKIINLNEASLEAHKQTRPTHLNECANLHNFKFIYNQMGSYLLLLILTFRCSFCNCDSFYLSSIIIIIIIPFNHYHSNDLKCVCLTTNYGVDHKKIF